MNDDRRLDLEQLFDQELPPVQADATLRSLADDPDAARHLARLDRLRSLAQNHDPAAKIAPRPVVMPLAPRSRRFALPALAAAALLLLAIPLIRLGNAPSAPAIVVHPTPSVSIATAPAAPRSLSGPSLEVGFYRWANASTRDNQEAARVVLSRVSPSRRSSAREVLALELANASPGAMERVKKVLNSHTPGRRSSSSHRHHPSASPSAS